MIQFFRIKFTANNYKGDVGYPVFWFSSSDEPIQLPITQRSNGGNLFYSSGYIKTDPFSRLSLFIMTRAETLIKHQCEWFNINVLTQTSGDNYFKITAADRTNAISSTWGGCTLPKMIDRPTTTTIEGTMNYLNNLFTPQKTRELLDSIPQLVAKGEDVIKEIIENSFIIAIIPTINELNFNVRLNEGLICRSSAGSGCMDTDIVFQAIKIGKVMPKAYIHTNNSYANIYRSPSICVTSMSIARNSLLDSDLEAVNLGVCHTGLTEANNRGETGFTTTIKANPTEYIPMEPVDKYKPIPVFTPLDFKGDLKVYRGNIMNKEHVDKKLNLGKLSLTNFGRLN